MAETSSLPTRKVTAGAIAGALSIVLVWMAKSMVGTEIPGEVASALTTLLTLLTSYIVPNAEG